jgi:hypothetical protein
LIREHASASLGPKGDAIRTTGEISRKEAAETRAQKLAVAGVQTAMRSRVTFRLAAPTIPAATGITIRLEDVLAPAGTIGRRDHAHDVE